MEEDSMVSRYDVFVNSLEEKYPKMFGGAYGGVCVGEGWWPIIESLCANIHAHVDWRNSTRARLLESNPYNHTIPDPVPEVVVRQIKEKFGGLRFYYEGGDETVDGLVRMAESWASHACEECGKPGKLRSDGWMRTLCDEHEAQRQAAMAKRFDPVE